MTIVIKFGLLEPGSGKFLTAIRHVLAAKYTELKHLFRRELGREIRTEVPAGRFGEVIEITFLHQVVNFDGDCALSRFGGRGHLVLASMRI